MTLHAITLADVLIHLGIGGLFLCTRECVGRFCKHRILLWSIIAVLSIIEAVALVAVVG